MAVSIKLVFTLISIVTLHYTAGHKNVEEGPCLNPNPKSVDFNISAIVPPSAKMYTTLWSAYEINHIVSTIAGKSPDDVTDEDIAESCPIIDAPVKTDHVMRGVHDGKKVVVEFEIVSTVENENGKSFNWVIKGIEESGGQSWVTKVGSDYLVYVTCWKTGQKSFVASSTTKKLSPEIKAEVIDHVKSLGFDPKFFRKYSYDDCDK